MGWPWPSACVAPRQQKDVFLFVKSQQQVRSCVIVYQSLGVKYYGLVFLGEGGSSLSCSLIFGWEGEDRIGKNHIFHFHLEIFLGGSLDCFDFMLVGGLEHGFYDFPYIYIFGIIIPTDFHIFQRGRSTTNQYVNHRNPMVNHDFPHFPWVSLMKRVSIFGHVDNIRYRFGYNISRIHVPRYRRYCWVYAPSIPQSELVGGFKHFLYCHPGDYFLPIDSRICFKFGWLNHQPVWLAQPSNWATLR